MKVLSNIFSMKSPTDLWCNMLQTLQKQKKYIGIVLKDKHTIYIHVYLSIYLSIYLSRFCIRLQVSCICNIQVYYICSNLKYKK